MRPRRVSVYDAAMRDQPWHFDDLRACLLDAIEVLNTKIRTVAHQSPSAPARDGGAQGVAQWHEELGRVVGTLEEAKKVILASLGPG